MNKTKLRVLFNMLTAQDLANIAVNIYIKHRTDEIKTIRELVMASCIESQQNDIIVDSQNLGPVITQSFLSYANKNYTNGSICINIKQIFTDGEYYLFTRFLTEIEYNLLTHNLRP